MRIGFVLAAVAVAALVVPLQEHDSPRSTAQRLSATSVAPLPATRSTLSGSKPNVVLVLADDMRADDLRFMPAVRRLLGGRGLTYRNSFSPYPLCCPARASLLTGQYAHNHRVISNNPPWGFRAFDDRRTLAGALRDAGYRTGFVGKYLNGYGTVPSKVTGRGSFHYVPRGWTDWYGAVQRPSESPLEGGGTYNYRNTIFNVNGRIDTGHRGRYQTNVLGGIARKLIRRYSRGTKPFFVMMSAIAPHSGIPREPGDPDRARRGKPGKADFRSPARPAWVRGRFDHVVKRGAGMPLDGGPAESDVSDKPRRMRAPKLSVKEHRALTNLTRQRAEALFVLDREIAKLVSTLRRSGELADTVFMFTSDNGYFLGEHRFRTGKSKPHEPSLRVPFVVAGPGIPHGVRYDPVRTIDLPATVLDLAGAAMPSPVDGVTLAPGFAGDLGWTYPVLTEARLHGPPGAPRRIAAPGEGFTAKRNAIGIRTPQWKLIRYAFGATELYDLTADPNELDNLAGRPAYAAVQAALTDLWWRYKDCLGAECNLPLPAEFAQEPGQLATTTETQRAGVAARLGHTF